MKTNYRLIILEQGNIIVSDEEIKKNDWKYCSIQKKPKRQGEDKQCICDSKKIIAGLKNQPTIDYNGLEEKFGIIDIEKLAKETTKKYINEREKQTAYLEFIEGFKKAQSLNDKKFSLEDVIGAMRHIFNQEVFYGKTIEETLKMRDKSMFDYIKFLQQPKVFDIEVEMECLNHIPNDSHTCVNKQPKITNNSIKITKVL